MGKCLLPETYFIHLTSFLQANSCNTGVIASNTHAWGCKEQGEHIDNED